MNRQGSTVPRLAGALLVAGLVMSACGRSGAGIAPATTGTAQAGQATVATDAPATPSEPASVENPGASPAPTASATDSPAATYAPPAPASDPVTGELSQLDQLIQNIGGSISGSNAGGE